MPRSRSLSFEGKKMFNLSLHASYQYPSRSSIRRCLHFLFSSKDDELISSMVSLCRDSSEFLMSNIYDLDNLPELIDQFIINVILLILKSPKDETRTAKYFEARKNVKLYLNVAQQCFSAGDHNTAWLLREALSHYAIKSLNLDSISKSTFFDLSKLEYGTFSNCYAKHVYSVPSVPDSSYVPIIPVLHMYSKRTNEHLKATSALGIKTSINLSTIETLISIYNSHFKHLTSEEKSLQDLYTVAVNLPSCIKKNPLRKPNVTKKCNFSDLCNLSKTVLSSGKINTEIKKAKRLKHTWRKKNGYTLAVKKI